jgi:GST-like protein
MQWLMFQMSHVGPMIGQAGHFANQAPEKIPYAIQRFIGESLRIIGVLELGLTGREHLAGDYSIADIATYPWIVAAWEPFARMMPDKIAEFPNVRAWLDRVGARPAVQRGMAIPKTS